MENATKALLMAAGVLIAIMVASLLVYMFSQMSAYQKSASDMEKDNQLAIFNVEFTQYAQDNILGTDVISLVNKVIDFNEKEIGAGGINYQQKVTITVTLGQEFANKYGVNGNLLAFEKNTYTITDENNDFVRIITDLRKVEEKYGLKTMDVLSSNLESLKTYYKDGDTFNGKSIKDVVGKNISEFEQDFRNGDFSIIEEHREYSELKIATFECVGEPEYKDGQVVKMEFKFKK